MKHGFLFALMITLCFSLEAQTKEVKDSTSDMIFVKVEVESAFPGGLAAWGSFLQQHLSYPKKAVKKNVQGTVILQFIVNENGTVEDIQAISGPELLREAAVKALKATPNWIPAKYNGRNVKSYKKQPVTFRIQ